MNFKFHIWWDEHVSLSLQFPRWGLHRRFGLILLHLGRWYVTLWTSKIRQCSSPTFWSSNLQSKYIIKISYILYNSCKHGVTFRFIPLFVFGWRYLYFLSFSLGNFGDAPRYSTPEIRTAVPCGLSLPFHLRGSAVGSGVQFAGAGKTDDT